MTELGALVATGAEPTGLGAPIGAPPVATRCPALAAVAANFDGVTVRGVAGGAAGLGAIVGREADAGLGAIVGRAADAGPGAIVGREADAGPGAIVGRAADEGPVTAPATCPDALAATGCPAAAATAEAPTLPLMRLLLRSTIGAGGTKLLCD